MLVLLPPSETKTVPGGRRRRLDLGALSWPELRIPREQALDALAATSAAPDALTRLGVGRSLAPEVERNTRLRTLPAVAAASLYTGVLYGALGLADLPPAARARAARQVVIVSALFGALRPGDRVPPYRLAMDADVPGLGPLAAFWRPRLDPVLTAAAGAGVVVDCRSSSYRAAWSPTGELAARTVAVRVVRQEAGRRIAVSHLAKLTRGEVVRHLLLRDGRPPRSARSLAAAAAEAFECELRAAEQPGRPWTLDVIVSEALPHND